MHLPSGGYIAGAGYCKGPIVPMELLGDIGTMNELLEIRIRVSKDHLDMGSLGSIFTIQD